MRSITFCAPASRSKTGRRLGRDFSLDSLKAEGFDAVLLAIGAHLGLQAGIPGEQDLEGVVNAVDWLREVNLGSRVCPGRKVVVIGGGNVAVDAARVARRLGSESVAIVYRRTRQEMPAYAEEIADALAEGIEIHYLTAPLRVMGRGGKAVGLECLRTELGPPDESGRRRPVPKAGSEFVIDCDAVIPAIGQRIDLGWAVGDNGVKTTARGAVAVDPHTMQTSRPYVFAAGDAVSGPATVIEAVAAGHLAVEAIDRFLRQQDLTGMAAEAAAQPPPGEDWAEVPRDIGRQERVRSRHLDAALRVGGFAEVDLNFDETEARREAGRCLNCGVCCECMECVRVCEAKAIDHGMRAEELQVKVGSIILATGYDLMDPGPMRQFGYGRYPNVFTSLEFERLSNATGPTGGRILIRDEDGRFTRTPQSVAILHCVGSRDVNYHEYCSRVCCMVALKYTHLIKEKVGHDTRVYDFYIDQRCYGKGYEEFYRRCQEEGTVFIRGKVAEITDQAASADEQGKLVALAEDTLSATRLRVPVDMVILCAAMESRDDSVGRGAGLRRQPGRGRLLPGGAPQAGPAQHGHRRGVPGGRLPGSEGHPGHGRPGLGRGGQVALAGQPGHGRDPVGHFLDRPRHLRRLPDLHRALPVCGHRVRPAAGGVGGQRGPVQGLRQLCRRLPQRRRPGAALQEGAAVRRVRRDHERPEGGRHVNAPG